MASKATTLFCVLLAFACWKASSLPLEAEREWIAVGRPEPEYTVTVTFAIRQTNVDWLERTLKAVSYPDSPEYGQYKNFDEIAEIVHGRPDAVDAVKTALERVGVSSADVRFTIGRDFAIADMKVAAAEELFQAELLHFRHRINTDLTTVKTRNFTIPRSLVDHVDFVCCIQHFPRANRFTVRPSPSGLGVTPSSLESDYNISEYRSSNSNNSQGVAAFLKQYFSESDLQKFQQKFDLPVKPVVKIIGKDNEHNPGGEANLDVQYIGATGRNVPTWFVSVSRYANDAQEDFLYWITELVNTTDSPWVHSVSYGDAEDSIDPDYRSRTDNEFMKFGVSGRSLLFASGDSGVTCKNGKFHPDWPTCSPYVTSVGGTTSLSRVWTMGGGGFSNVSPIPAYQVNAVKAYLNSGSAPDTKHFNTFGRAYPDVSLLAVGYEIVVDGITTGVEGTSCSAPTFAGIVSILNDVRLNKGMKTLGFLNPLLYQLQGKGFFDVTQGSNSGLSFMCPGFKAVPGWDPASGWGGPNFGILRDLVVQK